MRLETMKKQELKEKRERDRKILEEINRNLKMPETLKAEQKKDNQKKYIYILNIILSLFIILSPLYIGNALLIC